MAALQPRIIAIRTALGQKLQLVSEHTVASVDKTRLKQKPGKEVVLSQEIAFLREVRMNDSIDR